MLPKPTFTATCNLLLRKQNRWYALVVESVPQDVTASGLISMLLDHYNMKIISFRLKEDPTLFELLPADPVTTLPRASSMPLAEGKPVFASGKSFCLIEKKGVNAMVDLLADQSPIEPSSLNQSMDSLNLFPFLKDESFVSKSDRLMKLEACYLQANEQPVDAVKLIQTQKPPEFKQDKYAEHRQGSFTSRASTTSRGMLNFEVPSSGSY